MRVFLAILMLISVAAAQEPATPPPPADNPQTPAANQPMPVPQPAPPAPQVVKQQGGKAPLVLAAGTKIPLIMTHALSTKTARIGDAVYLQTTFPVVRDGKMVIPTGTYVQGRVENVKRPGRVKGRAEMLLHFTTMIFPNGYTVTLPGTVDSVPGADEKLKDAEGTMRGSGGKGNDAQQVASTTITGAMIGGAATRSGAGVQGGLITGAATGAAIALLTRGPELRLEAGDTVEMLLQRDVVLDGDKVGGDNQSPMTFRPYPKQK